MRLAVLLSAAFAIPAAAQEVLTAPAFEKLAEGRTLYFTEQGAPYGAEQYFSGRRSLWRDADGLCETGRWWGDADAICFGYEDGGPAQCWRFRRGPQGVTAELVENGADTGFVVEMSHADAEPLPCPGPRVGS